ncbi:MAG: hypothetical protein KKF62_12825 [Bacteroidetes bacterium]|nr:hypothetical protein [Bacteroidota bacterium]MBU1116407.1 hypothetical protein [Bacteroidota bacterium]MBU1798692.1 hypothetical protein [Bacteroidota bacterium]
MSNEIELKRNKYEMLKCIWMTSGVIDYKLCDNNFDCENCHFDKVIRNLSNEKETQFNGIVNDANTIFNKLQNIKYDNNIIYLKNNLIAKEICSNTFYLGINPILVSFLDNVNSMMIDECKKSISVGQQIIQINGYWGSVSISSPINFLIYNKIDDQTDNPLKTEWFAIMGAVHQDVLGCQLHQKEWDEMHAKAIGTIAEIKTQVPKVGDTMMDGGSQIKFLYQLVGNKRYIDILNSLIT